jgi:hypothetical protein
MAFSNFNPPFTNRTLEDFFEFPTEHTHTANTLKEWILDSYPDIEIGLSYHVPFFYINKKKLFYFHYYKNEDKELVLEISFIKGVYIDDTYSLFQEKNKNTKSILITDLSASFLRKLKYYIDAAVEQSL